MKKFFLLAMIILSLQGLTQPYLQASIQQGATPNKVNVNFLPNYTTTAGEFVSYITISIAIPTASASGVNPSITGAGPFTGMTFSQASPFSYVAGTETIFSWNYATGPTIMSWTNGVAFTGVVISFSGGTGDSKVRLVDFTNYTPGGGDNSSTYFLIVTNKSPYDVTNYENMFYPISGTNGSVTGRYDNGDQFVETVLPINLYSCVGGSAGTVNGSSPLCIGASFIYSSNGDIGGTWTSSNTSVATINASTGLVTTAGAGTADITYTVNGCSGPVSSFKTLTVNPNANAGTVTGSSPLCIGATTTYTSNGTTGGVWSSSNTSVASINSSTGLVTVVSAGTTNITYSIITGCGSPVSSFATLTVNANANAGTVSGTSPLTVGTTATYTSDGEAGGSWSSNNTSVATVDASTGFVTAVAAGTTNIIYTVSSGCNSPVSSFRTLSVGNTVNAGTVGGVSPLCINATSVYSTNGDAGGSWSSSNTSIATVDASTGLVTAMNAGTTNITYSIGDANSYKTLTINPDVNAGTVSGVSSICAGQATSFTSNGNSGGEWSSNNTTVATVEAGSGTVTSLTAGTAIISYTVTNSCGSATATKTITVLSNSATVINCPLVTSFTRTINGACKYSIEGTEFDVTATSACEFVTLIYSLSGATIGSGSSLAGVALNKGITTITWTAGSGSAISTCSLTVTVTDNIAPSISCPASIQETINGKGCSKKMRVSNPLISDNCELSMLTWIMTGATSGSSPATGINYVGMTNFNVGMTTVSYTVKDASGNTANCSFTVMITNPRCVNGGSQ